MIELQPGRFYRSRDGEKWCCFSRPGTAPHCAAHCVRVRDGRVEYFFIDGRYDSAGSREHTLIEEVSAE